jgi:DNA-binding transcriptional ArsR family regulator
MPGDRAKVDLKKQLPFVISRRAQLAALKAAARQELMDVLASMGTVSVVELAAALGRPPDSLYYHLRALQKVGLVYEDGTRESSGRSEKLYRSVSPDLRLQYIAGPKGNEKAVTAIVDSMLRLTSRDFKAAYANPATVVDGSEREIRATRSTGWLTHKQVAELNRQIQSMIDANIGSSPRKDDECLFALTVVLTPLRR